MLQDRFTHYTTVSWSGRQLLSRHKLSETGTWQIFGEDSNAELAGPHHTPLLATVDGKLEDVINYAIDLPRWATWGGGGEIRKTEVIKVDTAEILRRREMERELKDLEVRVKELKQELGK